MLSRESAWVTLVLQNGAMDACLEARGFPEWDWSLARSYAAPYDPLRPTEWFAELERPVYSENEIAMRDYLTAEVSEASMPEETAPLIEEWRALMRRTGVELGGDVTSYYECMDRAELPVLTAAGRDYDEIGEVMAGEAGRAGPAPAPGARQSARWRAFLTTEQQVTGADAACRADVYEQHIDELAPVIAGFATRHAPEIERAQHGWREIEDRAASLGYDGQRGALGG